MSNTNATFNKWFQLFTVHLYQDSLLHRYLKLDDRVSLLRHSPLGMFFYNQRALFFAFSGLFLLGMFLAVLVSPSDRNMELTIVFMAAFWGVSVILTLALHINFIKSLQQWAISPRVGVLPAIFSRYFLIDFVMVFSLILIGQKMNLRLDVLTFLLVANTVVYSAYVGGGRGFSLLITAVLFLLLVLTFLFFPITDIHIGDPRWFYLTLFLAPLLGMFLITVLSVSMISWLRTKEHRITRLHLELLGRYAEILSGEITKDAQGRKMRKPDQFTERQFRKHVNEVLQDLCSHKDLSWYRSACLWFLENHKDRGDLLIPGPAVDFDDAQGCLDGIDACTGFLSTSQLSLIRSMKYRTGRAAEMSPRFRAHINAPAAFIPLHRHGMRVGVLALYGDEGGPSPIRQERAFLHSLGSIISNTMEQWEGRYKSNPQREMDELFRYRSLDQVFPEAVKILQKYLMAAGCMVIFRPDDGQKEMAIVAKEGFDDSVRAVVYEVGKGQTGACAEKNAVIRFDDVAAHRKEFDQGMLEALEKAHGKPISSWMAIPITAGDKNYGVIKVVNSTYRCRWFTNEDQKVGENMALRLHVIISKFLQIERTEHARNDAAMQAREAQRHAHEALAARERAESTARQRQTDLMTMTHQLQGPLIPVIGTLGMLQRLSLKGRLQERLELAKALAEACLNLCWGISSSFAQDAGQKLSYDPVEIDVPTEMRKLCRMLQLANSREDITFRYIQDTDFPKLRMDFNVFTNVLFSLVHNAMKYAYDSSEVTLECSFERGTGEAAVKVKSFGEPIHPSECEAIFEQFRRGRNLEKSSRKHSGTGLGLWVARQLMREVGGNLTVQLSPRYPNLSIFVVHVPVAGR